MVKYKIYVPKAYNDESKQLFESYMELYCKNEDDIFDFAGYELYIKQNASTGFLKFHKKQTKLFEKAEKKGVKIG